MPGGIESVIAVDAQNLAVEAGDVVENDARVSRCGVHVTTSNGRTRLASSHKDTAAQIASAIQASEGGTMGGAVSRNN